MNMQLTPSSAALPRAYEAAKSALAQCQALDECKDWSDKAAALASYAKQAEDDALLKMATRIKARAVRRAGELLRQIEPASGARTDLQPSMGDRTRSETAQDAGMSKHQQMQATRIAAISEADFNAQVEGQSPPTLTQLASQGIKPRKVLDLNGRDPAEFNKALHFLGEFERYARDIEKHSLNEALPILTDTERDTLRGYINRIDAVHDRIMTRI